MTFYTLDDNKKAVPCSVVEMGKLFNQPEKRITKKSKFVCKKTGLTGELSTVFLGVNHSYGHTGKPVLWETMIFCNDHPHNNYLIRATSHKQALRVHNMVLDGYRNNHVLTRVGWGWDL